MEHAEQNYLEKQSYLGLYSIKLMWFYFKSTTFQKLSIFYTPQRLEREINCKNFTMCLFMLLIKDIIGFSGVNTARMLF